MRRSAQVIATSVFAAMSTLAFQASDTERASTLANRGVALLEQFRFADAAEASGASPPDVDNALGRLAIFKDKITGEVGLDG